MLVTNETESIIVVTCYVNRKPGEDHLVMFGQGENSEEVHGPLRFGKLINVEGLVTVATSGIITFDKGFGVIVFDPKRPISFVWHTPLGEEFGVRIKDFNLL
ncbi:MAG: hypothetical protein R3B53_04525 [Candidatus Paceibacterota bacterium]